MKKLIQVIIVGVTGIVLIGELIGNIGWGRHKCGDKFTNGKEYKYIPYATNVSTKRPFKISNMDFNIKLYKKHGEPEELESLNVFDRVVAMAKETDIDSGVEEFLKGKTNHETLTNTILYNLGNIEVFDHYHRLAEEVEVMEKETKVPDLEIVGLNNTVFSFIYNEDSTQIASFEIYNAKPEADVIRTLKECVDQFIVDSKYTSLTDEGIYWLDEDSLEYALYLHDEFKEGNFEAYDNRNIFIEQIDGDMLIFKGLSELHMHFISEEELKDCYQNPHAEYNNIMLR